MFIQCVWGKKRDQYILNNIFYKILSILMQFGEWFPRINLVQNDVNVYHLA